MSGLVTRKLTGLPPWPIVLLAGGEKVGKTWAAVEGCMSPLVAGGLWFPLGENDPDEYAQIPGFDGDQFDLVEHDGTYRGLRDALHAALKAEKARKRGKGEPPRVWVLDSGTRLWDLLSGMAQVEMYERLAKKAAQQNRPAPDVEQKPAMDLWNVAADRWGHIIDALREHDGPVVITARMELRTVMEKGEPTREKEQKILAQKSLPFDVDAIVQMVARGETYLTGVRSVKLAGLDPLVKFPKFTLHELWLRLGLDGTVGKRSHTGVDAADKPATEAGVARGELRALCDENGWDAKEVAALWTASSDVPLGECANAAAIRTFAAELVEQRKPKAVA